MNNFIKKNNEILFIYDAKLTNPNGDMDNENKPRMDYDTDTNLVSDVRLKRYLRDYFEDVLGKEIFITDKAKNAEDRAKQLKGNQKTYTDLIDVRLFGAVFAAEGGNDHITGPIQFTWGYSLNPVEINESFTITSKFSSGKGVGKDYRVKYSIIAFAGSINALVANESKLTEDDLKLFDKAMIKAIPLAKTRSKTGQTPRFYLRVELNDDKTMLKDLREYISIDYIVEDKYSLRSTADYKLNIEELINYLKSKNSKIGKIYYWKDDKFEINNWENFKKEFENNKLKELNIDIETS